MAEDFLEEIYQDGYLYTKLRELSEFARCNLVQRYVEEIKELLPELKVAAKRYIVVDNVRGELFFKNLQYMQELLGDNIRFVDLIDINILPLWEGYMNSFSPICVDDEAGLCLESSAHGFLTIRDIEGNFYFHSKWDPMWEAREQIRQLYDPIYSGWAMLGCGLGYHAYQLYRISDGSVKIHVFERDERIIQYAMQYWVLSWIPEECIQVTIGEDLMPFLECAEENEGAFYIFKQELGLIPEPYFVMIESLFINQCTRSFHRDQMLINYYRNVHSKARPVTELDISLFGEEFIIVAGGPSLDNCMDFLKESMGKKTVIAVGTVFKKLVQSGARPDLVTVLDPLKYTMKQLEGVEDETVPLLLATTAYWKWAARYAGRIYLAPVTSHLDQEEEYALKYGIEKWDVGGTVTSMAVRAALKFGAKKIYLLGADFAYPEGWTHATGTARQSKVDTSKLIPVKSVTGGIVYTEANMNLYREDMEGIIALNPEVEFINMSRIGAKIKGAREAE